MAELTLTASLENLDQVLDFVHRQLEAADCSERIIGQVDLAVEELYTNIANYAYCPQPGEAKIRCAVQGDPLQVVIGFTDQGKPYNPLQREDPDVTAGAEDRKIGGLGVFLAKKLMDELDYEFKDGSNVLTIRKRIDGEPR